MLELIEHGGEYELRACCGTAAFSKARLRDYA